MPHARRRVTLIPLSHAQLSKPTRKDLKSLPWASPGETTAAGGREGTDVVSRYLVSDTGASSGTHRQTCPGRPVPGPRIRGRVGGLCRANLIPWPDRMLQESQEAGNQLSSPVWALNLRGHGQLHLCCLSAQNPIHVPSSPLLSPSGVGGV